MQSVLNVSSALVERLPLEFSPLVSQPPAAEPATKKQRSERLFSDSESSDAGELEDFPGRNVFFPSQFFPKQTLFVNAIVIYSIVP